MKPQCPSTLRSAFQGSVPLALLALGCGAQVEDPDIDPFREELATGFQTPDQRFTNPWPSPGVVDVCFIQPSDATPAEQLVFIQRAFLTQDALERSWEQVTGLQFVYHGECDNTAPGADWLTLYFDSSVDLGGIAEYSMGGRLTEQGVQDAYGPTATIENRTDVQIFIGGGPVPLGDLQLGIVHEVGHALGFYHEHERDNNNAPSCPGPDPGNQNGWLTAQFDVESVMGYCATQRTGEDLLSPLDEVGAEILYPKDDSAPFVGTYQLAYAGGIVVRPDGAFVNEWYARGASPDVFVFSAAWAVGGSSVGTGFELPASALGDGFAGALTHSYLNRYRGLHSSPTPVTVDASAHTAVIVSAI